jgi:hypothetical protein
MVLCPKVPADFPNAAFHVFFIPFYIIPDGKFRGKGRGKFKKIRFYDIRVVYKTVKEVFAPEVKDDPFPLLFGFPDHPGDQPVGKPPCFGTGDNNPPVVRKQLTIGRHDPFLNAGCHRFSFFHQFRNAALFPVEQGITKPYGASAFHPFDSKTVFPTKIQKQGTKFASQLGKAGTFFAQLGQHPADIYPFTRGIQAVAGTAVYRIRNKRGKFQSFLKGRIKTDHQIIDVLHGNLIRLGKICKILYDKMRYLYNGG